MTNNNHPITPPPELVQQWVDSTRTDDCIGAYPEDWEQRIAAKAARWGADEELKACCLWVAQESRAACRRLKAHRRPTPLSLKEQALAELELLRGDANAHGLGFDAPAIRRALESLPD